jgi:hypothetical protein
VLKKFPQVVSMTPANGEEAVDAAATTTLRITFDRPMRAGSWSVVTFDRSQFPKLGKLAYDGTRQVLTIPVTLEPNHSYHFGLNAPGFIGFLAEDGTPLLPMEVKFRTAG